jgi:hypothetical protein
MKLLLAINGNAGLADAREQNELPKMKIVKFGGLSDTVLPNCRVNRSKFENEHNISFNRLSYRAKFWCK